MIFEIKLNRDLIFTVTLTEAKKLIRYNKEGNVVLKETAWNYGGFSDWEKALSAATSYILTYSNILSIEKKI